MNLSEYKETLQQSRGKLSHLKDSQAFAVGSEIELLERRDNTEEAQLFLQRVAQDTQNQLRYHIKDLMQLCLDTFWDGEIEFDMEFKSARGKIECKLMFIIDGEEVDIINGDGGGAVDISAFGLRLCAWTLGQTRNTMILDEPFKHLSEDHREQASAMLKELSDKLGLQMIIVTHDPKIADVADRTFKVERKRVGDWWESEVKTV